MNAETYARAVAAPGVGPGWTRVAQSIADMVSADAIDRVWLFAPIRREEREWGTAVVACRTDDDRRRLLTASYLLVVRGRERGQGRVTVEEVGESPPAVVHEVIAGVQERTGEVHPPIEVPADRWFHENGVHPVTAVADDAPQPTPDRVAGPETSTATFQGGAHRD